ncbi:MAG TPA: hypothetical protein VGA56_01330 [Opitutaceae bacterium]
MRFISFHFIAGIIFRSNDAGSPARFYLLSHPTHAAHPTRHIADASIEGGRLGATETASQRLLRKQIAPGLIESCQLTEFRRWMVDGSPLNAPAL